MYRNIKERQHYPGSKAAFRSRYRGDRDSDAELTSYLSPFFNWVSGSSPTTSTTSKAAAPSSYTKPPTESQLVSNAVASGERNENALTDMVFYKRHPELGGKPLSSSTPGFSTLSKEWVSIRDTIVRPVLSSPKAPSTIPPPTTGVGGGTASLQNVLNALTRKNYKIFTRPYELNIVGVRKNNPVPNKFDDTMHIFHKDNSGNWQYIVCAITTDPGSTYLLEPMKVSGTAIVVPGQYINSHQIGLHKGEYTALVQRGLITVTRDFNKDNVLDFRTGREETGYFGINIHRATSSGTSTSVGAYSAGCQVFASSSDFARFISLCQQHSNLYGNNFTYTLLEENDL